MRLISILLLLVVLVPPYSRVPQRIERVVNGLLPIVLIKGKPTIKMNLTDRMKHYKVPGVSIAVINNYQIEWARGFGVVETGAKQPVTTETLFQAGSISKPITAVAAMKFVQEGKLALDENVNSRLRSWKIPGNEFTKEHKVTVRRILSHAAGVTNSGVGEYACDEQKPTLLEALEGKPPSKNPATTVDFVPGSAFRYSGGGYSVLQQLLIDLANKNFPQLVQEDVFDRLKMNHSTFQQPPLPSKLASQVAVGHQPDGERFKCPFSYPEMAAAGLQTTPSDLARFLIDIQRSRMRMPGTLLSTEIVSQMLNPQIENVGLGFFLAGQGRASRFSHGGGNQGFFSYMVAYPETGQGAVVMVNGTEYWELVHEIVRGIAAEYNWPDYLHEHTLVKLDPARFGALVGRYEVAPDFVLTIANENGRLLLKESEAELLPESETEFFLMDGRQFRFTKDQQDRVNGMVVRQNDLIIRARRLPN